MFFRAKTPSKNFFYGSGLSAKGKHLNRPDLLRYPTFKRVLLFRNFVVY